MAKQCYNTCVTFFEAYKQLSSFINIGDKVFHPCGLNVNPIVHEGFGEICSCEFFVLIFEN